MSLKQTRFLLFNLYSRGYTESVSHHSVMQILILMLKRNFNFQFAMQAMQTLFIY